VANGATLPGGTTGKSWDTEAKVAKAEWGTKRLCPNCGTRYYDMRRDPVVCPHCGSPFDPEALLKTRRTRAVAPVVADAVVEEEIEPDLGAEEVPEPALADVVVPADPEAEEEDEAEEAEAEEEEEEVPEDASELGEDEDDMAEVIENVDEEDE